MKSTIKFIAILFVLIFVVALWFLWQWFDFLHTPLIKSDAPATSIIFAPKTSSRVFALQLKELHLIKHPAYFVLLSRYKGYARILKAGEYRIDPGMTAEQLLSKMARGDMVRHTLTIIEGWNFRQVITALQNNPYITHTLNASDPAIIMQQIGHEGEMPEGRFAPDTYIFSGKINDTDLLIMAYQLMQKRINQEWLGRSVYATYHCPYDALIAASIIEKETAHNAEKPLIAGVILQRLTRDMLLQLDPTVIYGMGTKYTGKLTIKDLQTPSPYNTYLRKGLPPSPIAMPGLDSLHAALHPILTTALYYVAKGDGTHVFSHTLQEQDQAIKKYLMH